MPVGYLSVFFGKRPVQALCSFFKSGCLGFYFELYEFFVYFHINPLSGVLLTVIIPFSSGLLASFDSFFHCAKAI